MLIPPPPPQFVCFACFGASACCKKLKRRKRRGRGGGVPAAAARLLTPPSPSPLLLPPSIFSGLCGVTQGQGTNVVKKRKKGTFPGVVPKGEKMCCTRNVGPVFSPGDTRGRKGSPTVQKKKEEKGGGGRMGRKGLFNHCPGGGL